MSEVMNVGVMNVGQSIETISDCRSINTSNLRIGSYDDKDDKDDNGDNDDNDNDRFL